MKTKFLIMVSVFFVLAIDSNFACSGESIKVIDQLPKKINDTKSHFKRRLVFAGLCFLWIVLRIQYSKKIVEVIKGDLRDNYNFNLLNQKLRR